MNTVEDRLRDALRERARHSPVDPDAWSRTVARSRAPWWRPRRAGFLAPLAAAAAIVTVITGVTVAVHSPSGRPGGTSSRASASPSPTPSPSGTPCDVQDLRMLCASSVVHVNRGSGASATVTSMSFGYGINTTTGQVGHALLFCALTRLAHRPAPNSAGPDGGGNCAGASLARDELVRSSGTIMNLQWGLADSQVASVTAVLTNGGRVPGVVVSGRGFPYRAWLASYPKEDPATLLFSDRAGRQVGKLFIPAYDQDFRVPRSGGIALFPVKGGTMTAYLVKGMITFWVSNSWNGGFPVAGWPAVTGLIGSGSYWAGSECFGYVHPGVARVVIRLDNGYQREVSAFTPGWSGSGLRLFASALPRSFFPKDSASAQAPPQGTVTAYDAAGRVLATEPLIGTGS
jgi:hypothetical protein